MYQYDKLAVNTIVRNKNGGVSSCDVPFSKKLLDFNRDYLRLTKQVADSCINHDLPEYMVIGTSAIVNTEIDGAVGMNSGIFNNPFLIWGRYRSCFGRAMLKISFQFHHTQMDGAHAGKFLELLQKNIDNIERKQQLEKRDMKNKLFLMILGIMACSLCACGQQTTETMINTGNSTEQVTASEDNSEQITAKETKDNNMEQTETTEQNQLQDVMPSYKEFRVVLDEINTDIQPGTAGNGMNSVKVAAHLLNWGVGTSMTTDEIKKETVSWLSDKGNSEQVEFSNKLASVYDAYQKLLSPDAKDLLEQAGCDDAAYPWSDTPVETVEAIVEVVQLPEEQVVDDSNLSPGNFENKDNWPDVEELVNQKGDETTVYLLADGRYMDRINAVYIYDGKDTWTDEAGVEWNKAVK